MENFILPKPGTELFRHQCFSNCNSFILVGTHTHWRKIYQTGPQKRQIVLGTRFNFFNTISLFIDPHYVFSLPAEDRFGYSAGGELTIFNDFSIRGGYFQKTFLPFLGQRANGASFGLGWQAPKISFDYAFTQVFDGPSSHIVGITLIL